MTAPGNHRQQLSLNSGHLSQLSFIFKENWLLFFVRDVNVMLRKNICTFHTLKLDIIEIRKMI